MSATSGLDDGSGLYLLAMYCARSFSAQPVFASGHPVRPKYVPSRITHSRRFGIEIEPRAFRSTRHNLTISLMSPGRRVVSASDLIDHKPAPVSLGAQGQHREAEVLSCVGQRHGRIVVRERLPHIRCECGVRRCLP
jgi:hypothetical protein